MGDGREMKEIHQEFLTGERALFQGKNLTVAAPLDKENPVASCRNADAPYFEGQYVVTVDGFLVSSNVTVNSATVIDTGFAYSDHNPVTMTFVLQP